MRYFLAAFLILSQGCRLLQHTDLSGRDPATRTVFVHNFTNATFQPDVNGELTEWVRRELNRRDNFKTTRTKDDARFWLYGDIVLFSKEGQMYDNFRNPVRYEMLAGVKIKIRENPAKGAPDRFLDTAGEQSASVQYSEKEGYTEPEFQARQRLLRILAAKIADNLESEYLRWFP